MPPVGFFAPSTRGIVRCLPIRTICSLSLLWTWTAHVPLSRLLLSLSPRKRRKWGCCFHDHTRFDSPHVPPSQTSHPWITLISQCAIAGLYVPIVAAPASRAVRKKELKGCTLDASRQLIPRPRIAHFRCYLTSPTPKDSLSSVAQDEGKRHTGIVYSVLRTYVQHVLANSPMKGKYLDQRNNPPQPRLTRTIGPHDLLVIRPHSIAAFNLPLTLSLRKALSRHPSRNIACKTRLCQLRCCA